MHIKLTRYDTIMPASMQELNTPTSMYVVHFQT